MFVIVLISTDKDYSYGRPGTKLRECVSVDLGLVKAQSFPAPYCVGVIHMDIMSE